MDSAHPMPIPPSRPGNPFTAPLRAAADKVDRLEANVVNLPLTSLFSAIIFGAGVVALGILIGQALEGRPAKLSDGDFNA